MQHYAAFIDQKAKLSITPMYSATGGLSLAMRWGVKWHAHGWKLGAYGRTMDPEMAGTHLA